MGKQIAIVRNAVGRTSGIGPWIIEEFSVQIGPENGVMTDYTSNFSAQYSTTHDADASFASASFQVERPFSLGAGRWVIQLNCGWRGEALPIAFRGEITNRQETYYRRTDTIQAAGVLRRTQVGIDVNLAFYWSGLTGTDLDDMMDLMPAGFLPTPITTDADIIIKILEIYGIDAPHTWNHSIEASPWNGNGPARLEPILWSSGQAGWDIISELDKCTTYRTFDGRNGAVYRRPALGGIPGGVRHVFEQGKDILNLTRGTTYEVYNQVIVRGAMLPSLADTTSPDDPDPDPLGDVVVGIAPTPGPPASSSYIQNPPGVRTDESVNSQYIETVPDAEYLADILLGYLKQPVQDIQLDTFGCSDLDVSNGIGIDAEVMNMDLSGFLITHTISGGPLRSSLKIRGSSEAEPRGNIPPTPLFTTELMLEHLIIGGVLTQVVFIIVDATGSSDDDGRIVGVTITVGGDTRTFSDVTQARAVFKWLGGSPATVTVVVTDDGGLSATLSQEVSWTAESIPVEPLVAAEATAASASVDGEATWREAAMSARVVAPIALGSRTCYGTFAGEIYATDDYLLTPPVLKTTLPAAVTSMWNNEKLTDRWIVGLQNGDVWLSIDNAETWAKASTIGNAPVVDIAESPDAANQITACCGNNLWTTFDAVTWLILISADSGALRFAAAGYEGVPRVYCSFLNGQIRRWMSGDPMGGEGELIATLDGTAATGLTLKVESEELYMFTPGINTFIWNEAEGLIAGPPTGTGTNYAIRSGKGFWTYVATNGAIGKWFPRDAYYDIRILNSPKQGRMVGYGAQGTLVPPPPSAAGMELLVPTAYNSNNTATSGVWRFHKDTGWTLIKVGDASLDGVDWQGITTSPANPNHWLIWGKKYRMPDALNAYVFFTSDAGATWSQVDVLGAMGNTWLQSSNWCFSFDGTKVYGVGEELTQGSPSGGQGYLYTGAPTGGTLHRVDLETTFNIRGHGSSIPVAITGGVAWQIEAAYELGRNYYNIGFYLDNGTIDVLYGWRDDQYQQGSPPNPDSSNTRQTARWLQNAWSIPGTRKVYAMYDKNHAWAPKGNEMGYTNDATTARPALFTDFVSDTSDSFVVFNMAVFANGNAIVQALDGIYMWPDPINHQSRFDMVKVTESDPEKFPQDNVGKLGIRTDFQTQSVAAFRKAVLQFYTWDGTNWAKVPQPPTGLPSPGIVFTPGPFAVVTSPFEVG